MTPSPHNRDPLSSREACLTLLAAAKSRGFTMTRTKLAKLLYLADLEAWRTIRKPLSTIEWRWDNFGPFDTALLQMEDDLVAEGAIDRNTSADIYGKTHEIQSTGRDLGSDDPVRLGIVTSIVDRFGALAASTLRDITYKTEPMRAVQEEGRGALLDLSVVAPLPDMAAVGARFRRVLDSLPAQETDEGVFDQLVSENEYLRSHRMRANTETL